MSSNLHPRSEVKMTRWVILGALAGLVFGALVAAFALLNQGDSAGVQSVSNFFAALPAYIAHESSLSTLGFYGFFFIYWTCLGAALGSLANSTWRHRNRLFAATVSALALLHALAQLQLEQDIVKSIKAVFTAILP